MEDQQPSQIPSESVKLNGVPSSATLSVNGDLSFRQSSSSTDISLEREVLGIELRGTLLTVRAFVDAAEAPGCFLSKEEVRRRVRRDFVVELGTEEAGMIWGQKLSLCLNNLGRPKRLFIVLNPFGGNKNAKKIFLTQVAPLFQAANILYTVQETNYQLHAQEIAKALDLRKFDGIICVSGDGILVEVVNGLLQREDWKTAIKIPLGIIPAGTGNGMVKSLLHSAGDPYSISNAVFSIIRGNKRALDVTSVVQGQTKYFSVLMLTWGLIADIDIESEKYRWMGSSRLDFYSLLRILNLRKYTGQVQFIPAPGFESIGLPIQTLNQSLNPKPLGSADLSDSESLNPKPLDSEWRFLEGPFLHVGLMNVSWCSEDAMPAPHAQFSDGYLDAVIIKDCRKSVLLGLMLKLGDGSYVNSPHVIYMKVKAFRLTPGQRIGDPKKGGIVDADGEILARGDLNLNLNSDLGLLNGDEKQKGRKYLMDYGSPIHMSVNQGLATIFSPS